MFFPSLPCLSPPFLCSFVFSLLFFPISLCLSHYSLSSILFLFTSSVFSLFFSLISPFLSHFFNLKCITGSHFLFSSSTALPDPVLSTVISCLPASHISLCLPVLPFSLFSRLALLHFFGFSSPRLPFQLLSCTT